MVKSHLKGIPSAAAAEMTVAQTPGGHPCSTPTPSPSLFKNPYYMAWLREQELQQQGQVLEESPVRHFVDMPEPLTQASGIPSESLSTSPLTSAAASSQHLRFEMPSCASSTSCSVQPDCRGRKKARTPSEEPSPMALPELWKPPLKRLRVFGPWDENSEAGSDCENRFENPVSVLGNTAQIPECVNMKKSLRRRPRGDAALSPPNCRRNLALIFEDEDSAPDPPVTYALVRIKAPKPLRR